MSPTPSLGRTCLWGGAPTLPDMEAPGLGLPGQGVPGDRCPRGQPSPPLGWERNPQHRLAPDLLRAGYRTPRLSPKVAAFSQWAGPGAGCAWVPSPGDRDCVLGATRWPVSRSEKAMSELVHPRSGSIARASPPRMTPAAPSCCSGTNSWVCVLEPLWGRHCWGAGRVLPGTMSTGGEAACPTPTPHPWIIQRQRKDLFSGVIQGPPPKERVLLPGAVEGAPGAPQEPGGRWGGGWARRACWVLLHTHGATLLDAHRLLCAGRAGTKRFPLLSRTRLGFHPRCLSKVKERSPLVSTWDTAVKMGTGPQLERVRAAGVAGPGAHRQGLSGAMQLSVGNCCKSALVKGVRLCAPALPNYSCQAACWGGALADL